MFLPTRQGRYQSRPSGSNIYLVVTLSPELRLDKSTSQRAHTAPVPSADQTALKEKKRNRSDGTGGTDATDEKRPLERFIKKVKRIVTGEAIRALVKVNHDKLVYVFFSFAKVLMIDRALIPVSYT
jgi:hypothetical protein